MIIVFIFTRNEIMVLFNLWLLNSRRHSLIFLQTLSGLFLSRSFVEFPLKVVYPTMIRGNSNFWYYWKMYLQVKKFKVEIFTNTPKTKFSPDSYHHSPKAKGNYLCPPGSVFSKIYFHPSRKGRGNYANWASFRQLKLADFIVKVLVYTEPKTSLKQLHR